MAFMTFNWLYLGTSVLASAFALWRVRRVRQDFLHDIFTFYAFEWEYFLMSWTVMYGLAPLIVAEGIKYLEEKDRIQSPLEGH